MSTAHTNLGPGLPIVGQSSTTLATVAAARAKPTPPLPMSRGEMHARGWDEVDIVFVTGDAYVDHPSFAMALLGRLLESEGFRVAILSQPDWHIVRRLADVRPAAAVLRHQRRQHGLDDQPLHGQPQGPQRRRLQPRRPDRPAARPRHAGLLPAGPRGVSTACRSSPAASRPACGGWPTTTTGATRSAARSSSTARPTCWSSAWASAAIVEIARRLAAGQTRARPARHARRGLSPGRQRNAADARTRSRCPATSKSSTDKLAFAEMTKIAHNETNPYNARRLVQYHGREAVVANPPALPLSQAEMDRVYGLPFTRKPHPSYGRQPIPAFEVVKDSVQIMRGCFGGCTFCSITAHEGRIIQSRSQESVLGEIRQMTADPDFKGVVSDIGGPTANMYQMRCTRPEVEANCRRLSCVHPDDLQAAGHRSRPARSS